MDALPMLQRAWRMIGDRKVFRSQPQTRLRQLGKSFTFAAKACARTVQSGSSANTRPMSFMNAPQPLAVISTASTSPAFAASSKATTSRRA